MMKRPPSKGLTLGEVLVVLIIIGILAAVLAPGFYATLHSYRVRRGVRQVFSMVQFARSRAAMRNRAYRLRFGAMNQSYPDPKTQPKRCLSDSIDLAKDGWVILDEGATSACNSFVDKGMTNIPDARCLDSFRFNFHLGDVAIMALYQDGTKINSAEICIKPDGRVLNFSGTPTKLNVCVVGVRATLGSVATLPRQLSIGFNGQAVITSGSCSGK